MSNRIITISRQFGSGGRTIGRLAAERLGINCYDQEVLDKISMESGLDKEFVSENSEYASYGGLFGSMFLGRNYNGHSIQDDLWVIQKEVIRDIADKESCIIVGRCADYILRDKEQWDCLNVFVYADPEKRADRIVKEYGETSDAPFKRLKDKDHRRAAYYQFYTDRKWGKLENYHIALDSGTLGIDKCVDILCELY